MSSSKPILVLVQGSAPLSDDARSVLESFFQVREVDQQEAAGLLVESSALAFTSPEAKQATEEVTATRILQQFAEGVGIVDRRGEIEWMNRKLSEIDPETMRRFTDACVGALQGGDTTNQRWTFTSGGSSYEVAISPMSYDEDMEGKSELRSVVGMLLDSTAIQKIRERIERIDQAGADLIDIDSDQIKTLNSSERLIMLEGRIVKCIKEVLNREHFEVRLLDRRTGKLELVIGNGIDPLKVGEVIHAEVDGNGISGRVAATGKNYICRDTKIDPLYLGGMEHAGSSLTVAMRLRDRIMGVINIESAEVDDFTEEDLFCTELLGRYVAMAINMLDMLVVERYTTNEKISHDLAGQITTPLDELEQLTSGLESITGNQELASRTERMMELMTVIRNRVHDCTSGPRTIIGAEEAMKTDIDDPLLNGVRVLVADDEPEIRTSMQGILSRHGCDVTCCSDGNTAIEAIQAEAQRGGSFDLVISDVKMPDRNGYEVFKATKDVNQDTPVILMTGFGYDPHHSIVRSSQEGLKSFLFKPFAVEQLINDVHKALGASRGKGGR